MILKKELTRLITLLILFTLCSCANEPTSINGHYHFFNSEGGPYYYSTLDIVDSTAIIDIAKFDQLNYYVKHVEGSNQLELLSDIYNNYRFELYKDTLLVLDNNRKRIFVGSKPKSANCSLEADCFASEMVDINLPIFSQEEIVDSVNTALQVKLFAGKPKLIFQNKYGDKTRLQTNRGFIDFEEIELVNYQFNEKLKENTQHKISAALYIDKQTSTNFLIKILEEQKKLVDRDIYIVGKLNQKTTKENKLVFKKINLEIKIDSNITVDEWLQQH